MKYLYLCVLLVISSLSGCIVVPAHPVYVHPSAIIVAPAPIYVAPPMATAIIVTRPIHRNVIIARY
jgi:hypothetical protein